MWWSRFKPIRSVSDLVGRKKTAEDVAYWIEQNIDYRENPLFRWPTSEEVLKHRIANCKGFSVLSYDAMKSLGHDPHIVSYMWEGLNGKLNHACVMLEIDSVWHCLSLGILIRLKSATLEKAVKEMEPETLFAQELKPDGNSIQVIVLNITKDKWICPHCEREASGNVCTAYLEARPK